MNIVRKDFPGHYEGGQEILLPNFLLPSFESGSLELRLCGAGDFEPHRIITRAMLRGTPELICLFDAIEVTAIHGISNTDDNGA